MSEFTPPGPERQQNSTPLSDQTSDPAAADGRHKGAAPLASRRGTGLPGCRPIGHPDPARWLEGPDLPLGAVPAGVGKRVAGQKVVSRR